MKEELLQFLECPECRASLVMHADEVEGDRVRTGSVTCAAGHQFPIRAFVPLFDSGQDYMGVFTSMRMGTEGTLPTAGDLDVERITRKEFTAQTGLDPETLRGKWVLDAGCGGGRVVALLAGCGARVVGVDLDAAGLAQIAARAADDVHVLQADLFRLPLRPHSFDFIFSLGVLHHTPDPPGAFHHLRRFLKPRGQIAIWVYPKSERTPISDLVRPVTTRLPYLALYCLAVAVTAAYGPLLRVRGVKSRLQSLLYRTRLPWHEERKWRVHSFLDWYGPRYQFKYTPAELEQWCVTAGLTEVAKCADPSSVRATAP